MGLEAGPFPFGEWKPDLTDLDTNTSGDILNVVPRADGYGPFQDFVAFTQSLPGPCRGYFFARNGDGSVTVFAATATDLYVLSNTNFSWSLASAGSAPYYTSVPGTSNWSFAQFNNLVIAVQINCAPQVFTLGSSSQFSALGGSPPNASYVTVINRFVVLSGILSFPYRVQWSGLNAPTTWDNITAQSNYEDMPFGGRVLAVAGGDLFGVIFQDSCIRSMTFTPGGVTAFDIFVIATNDGLIGPFAYVMAADSVFFVSPQGFKVIPPQGYPTPIGKEKVDRTLFANLDTANLQLLQGATDPTTTRVYFAFKSNAGSAGQFDTIYCFDRVLERWTEIAMSGQYLAALSKPGLSLDALDAIAPGIITISGAANNGSGAIRLTISGLTAGSGTGHTNLNTENLVTVYGVIGTTEANGNWPFTIINSTHIDLVGSTFTNAYVSGGQIGGSLDQLGFSLDSISTAALAQLSMVGTANSAGFFTGSNLQGVMETPEEDGDGRRIFLHNVRPMTDCGTATISVAWRDNAQATPAYTSETAVNAVGLCPIQGGGIDGRYVRIKVRMPYGATWTYCLGVEPEFRFTGPL